MAQRILIIDEDISNAGVFADRFKNEGFEVEVIRDHSNALKAIEEKKPDLVLLDIILTDAHRYDILEAKLKNPTIAAIPVIVVANSDTTIEVSRVLSLGVKHYFIKSQFEVGDVVTAIRAELNGGVSFDAASVPNDQILNQASVPQTPFSGKKVLWVEDDKFLGDILSKKLTSQGASVYRAKNGEEAFEYLKKETPHIILLDIILPGLDGFEILQKIRMQPNTKGTPVIMLSNVSQSGEIEKSKLLGAQAFLVKATVTLDQILREIKEVLQK